MEGDPLTDPLAPSAMPDPMGGRSFDLEQPPEPESYDNSNFPSGGVLPDYGFGDPSQMSKAGMSPGAFGEIRSDVPGEPTGEDRGTMDDYARSGFAGQLEPTIANDVQWAVPGAMPTSLALGAIDPLSKAIPQFGEDMQTLGGAFLPSASAGEKEGASEEVKALQIKLKNAGLYQGKIDGIMKGETAAAQEKFQALEERRLGLEAQTKGAAAALAEADRKAKEETNRASERQAGERRLQDIEKNVPWAQKALRNYGPLVGYGLGAGIGFGTKWGLSRKFNNDAKTFAADAEAIMARPAKDLPSRAGRVNDFWNKGQGRNPEAPFERAPGGKGAFKPNKDAPEASKLYQPNPIKNAAVDAGVVGGFGLESGATQWLANNEKEELDKAQEAVSKDPSTANIQRLETAKDLFSVYEAGTNAGRAGIGSYLTGLKFLPRKSVRPSTQEAEAERARIDKSLAPKRTAKKPPPQKKAKFIPGVPGKPHSGLNAKGLADSLNEPATAWFKSNPNKHLNGTHVKEMLTTQGVNVSDSQAANVARRLRTQYGEKYINGGAKATLTKTEPKAKASDEARMDENGNWVKPPKDIDPNGPGNF